jgi:hypothetical protein
MQMYWSAADMVIDQEKHMMYGLSATPWLSAQWTMQSDCLQCA